VRGACGRATDGYSAGGSGNRTSSLEPIAVPGKEAQICVLCLS
jgi:hypothetical protein